MRPMAKIWRRLPKWAFGNKKAYSLDMWNSVVITTTSQGCNGNPDRVWAVDEEIPRTS